PVPPPPHTPSLHDALPISLAAARGTLRHPYPRGWLGEALTLLAFNGPAATADSLLAAAVAGRSGWYRIHELRAVAALRVGRCDRSEEHTSELQSRFELVCR